MAQPRFAPIAAPDEVRAAYRLEVPRPWVPHRPGEFVKDAAGVRGAPGPDQGYALGLVERLRDRLVLTPSEHAEDALAAAVVLALRRASLFGRAPVLGDLELALSLLGFLGPAEPEFVVYRKGLVDGIGHDYERQRVLSASVPLESLGGPGGPSAAGDWRERLGLKAPA